MKQISYEILKNLRLKNGLFIAAPSSIYNKAWLRDNIYSAIGLEIVNVKEAIQTYHALLDILKKHEYKINFAIKEKPKHAYQYIHARYNPETLEEYHEEWGNKQNDAIGALLFKIAELLDKKLPVLRNLDDYRIIQKLVFYLESIEYWHDKDNGMWEEYEEIHASSVGACLAGLKAIANQVYVPSHLIEKGQETLNLLLPKESETKETDLALLSLIYPYNIVNDKQKSLILKNVEEKLLREKGVIRYINDQYFNKG
ncbi:MAG TPA: glycoside hydrolase family 15 protein, partial [Candidatus Nanoarchaeia archaeon]|nr:glycoside hydrolase family 15 protein [Candidatus Nanoarchaeia archaeon]